MKDSVIIFNYCDLAVCFHDMNISKANESTAIRLAL
jgi:hypothetical protein